MQIWVAPYELLEMRVLARVGFEHSYFSGAACEAAEEQRVQASMRSYICYVRSRADQTPRAAKFAVVAVHEPTGPEEGRVCLRASAPNGGLQRCAHRAARPTCCRRPLSAFRTVTCVTRR